MSTFSAGLCVGRPVLDGARPVASKVARIEEPARIDERALLVFAEADDAGAFMTGLRQQITSCARIVVRPDGSTRHLVTRDLTGWDDALAVLRVDDGTTVMSPYPPTGSWLLAARHGSAVVLRFDQSEYYLDASRVHTIDAQRLAGERRPVDALKAATCRWAAC